MTHEQAASDQHSVVSENQHQHQPQQRVQQQVESLALKLAQTYEELTRLLERNPGMKRQITEG